MKKIVLGIIIGIGLSLGVTAYADNIVSLIGKKVDGSFPLLINNIRADKDVLVIDGTSYLPVRAAAALFGYDVSFNADLMVILNKKSDTDLKKTADEAVKTAATATPLPTSTPVPLSSQTPAPAATSTPMSNDELIEKIKIDIIGMNAQIDAVSGEIKKNEAVLKSIQNDVNQTAKIQSTKAEITRLNAVYADFIKQLDKLNKRLKQLK